MYISTKWLNNYIDLTNITLEELELAINKHIIELDGSNALVNATNLVVGHVVSREKHPDAEKLSVCQVNIGEETLQIVCGAKNVAAGQNVIVALVGAVLPGDFKIGKSKIRGVESFGMICSLSELGIDAKFQSEEDKEGIKVLGADAIPGSNPIEYLDFDTHVFELGLTPNRMDLLSYFGFAKDLGAVLNQDVNLKDVDLEVLDIENDMEVKVETVNAPYYGVMKLTNVEVKPSLPYIQAALIANNIRPINNIVDATNYVMLETGCPLHAFDANVIGNKIVVRESNCEEVVTLDGITRKLNDSDIVITAKDKVIAIAGLMGTENSKVTEGTTEIVLEGALFNDSFIRKTSSRLGLRTDASVRFERKVNPEMIGYAVSRCAALIQESCKAQILMGLSDISSIDPEDLVTELEITVDQINGYLGTKFDDEEVIEILTRLGFDTIMDIDYDSLVSVIIPARRLDVNTFQDVCEEVARIYGFDNIPTTLPAMLGSKQGLTPWQSFLRKVRKTALGLGLNEVRTYSLVSKNYLDIFADFNEDDSKKLLMPLSEEREYLRTSLIPSMVDVIEYNTKRNIKNVNIFELGDIYNGEESKDLTILLSGALTESTWTESHGSLSRKEEKVDFYVAKGLMDAVLNEFNLTGKLFQVNDLKNFHPGQTGLIMIDGVQVGTIGLLHPTYLKGKDLDKVFAITLSLNTLFTKVNTNVYYQEVPKYPSMQRDLAIVVAENVTIDDIKTVCADAGKKMLKNVSIFDVYTGDKIEAGFKSIAINLVFQDLEKTLETDEVNARFNKIIKDLQYKINAKLRA